MVSNLDVSTLKSSIATNYSPSPEELFLISHIQLPTISSSITFLGSVIMCDPTTQYNHPHPDLLTVDSKIEKFSKIFKSLYLKQVGRERAAQVYLSSLINFYGSQHLFTSNQLKSTQRKLMPLSLGSPTQKASKSIFPLNLVDLAVLILSP